MCILWQEVHVTFIQKESVQFISLHFDLVNSLAGDGSLPNYRSQYWISNPDFDAGSGAVSCVMSWIQKQSLWSIFGLAKKNNYAWVKSNGWANSLQLLGPSPRQKPVKVRPPQLSSNAYPLLERFFPASPSHGLANVQGLDVGDMVSSKSFQQPKKRQNVEEVMDGSVPQIDYTLEDDSVPPHGRPASKLEDYTLTPPSPKAKTKIKATSPDGLSRYFIFSNLKRARDGCKFLKLSPTFKNKKGYFWILSIRNDHHFHAGRWTESFLDIGKVDAVTGRFAVCRIFITLRFASNILFPFNPRISLMTTLLYLSWP